MVVVKLLTDIPVEVKHGLFAGKAFSAKRKDRSGGRDRAGFIVMGDYGEEITVWAEECEIVVEDG